MFFYRKFNLLQIELQKYYNNIDFKNDLGLSYQFLGDISLDLADWETTLNSYLEMNTIFKELYQNDRKNVKFRDHLAISCLKLADFYLMCSAVDEAKTYYFECQKHYSELVQNFPAYAKFQFNLQAVETRLQELSASGF